MQYSSTYEPSMSMECFLVTSGILDPYHLVANKAADDEPKSLFASTARRVG